MKMRKLFLAAGLTAVIVMAGCGQDTAEENAPVQETEQTEDAAASEGTEEETEAAESAQVEETAAETDTEDTAETGTEETDTAEAQGESADTAQTYEDNFAVDEEAVVAFGEKIKEAVAAKDLEALADLTSYPVYVGLPDTDGIVETRDDFLALGADQVFTEELTASVEAADVSGQEPSMAGFVVAGENGRPNIIFGVVDGKLAVTGINY